MVQTQGAKQPASCWFHFRGSPNPSGVGADGRESGAGPPSNSPTPTGPQFVPGVTRLPQQKPAAGVWIDVLCCCCQQEHNAETSLIMQLRWKSSDSFKWQNKHQCQGSGPRPLHLLRCTCSCLLLLNNYVSFLIWFFLNAVLLCQFL